MPLYEAQIEQYAATSVDWPDKYDPWSEYCYKEIHGFHFGLAIQSFLMACGIISLIIGGCLVFSFIINY